MARANPKDNMNKAKRRRFSAEFKARLALEAARGVKTVNEIAAENEVHPVQVSKWKKELVQGAPAVFEREGKAGREQEEAAQRVARLERKVGQLTVELDWLTKKSKELGL